MRLLAICAFTTLLAACGGGGGGGDGAVTDPGSHVWVPTPPPVPPTGAGTLQLLDLSTGTLGAQTLDGSTYDPVATLDGTHVSFRALPGGRWLAGSPESELGHRSNEGVRVARVTPFLLGSLELTQAQWTTLATAAGFADEAHLQPWHATTPAAAAGPASDVATRPVTMLSRTLIDEVLAGWNSARPPYRLRLPNAAEWEFACRAGSVTAWSWGADGATATAAQYGVVAETRGTIGPMPVGGRLPNAFRLFDMHGNVWEHIGDGPDGALRGGSWADNLLAARSSCRQELDRDTAHAAAGVRLVLVITP